VVLWVHHASILRVGFLIFALAAFLTQRLEDADDIQSFLHALHGYRDTLSNSGARVMRYALDLGAIRGVSIPWIIPSQSLLGLEPNICPACRIIGASL
jgi:hypothetical protein